MQKSRPIPNRKRNRLKGYDYSNPGGYFLTICTKKRFNLFGDVVNSEMILNNYGNIAHKMWSGLTKVFRNIVLDQFIIMPNHVHVLIATNAQFELGRIVRSWKAYSAAKINALLGRRGRLWAADYFDRYVRDQAHFETTKRYIEMNPVAAGLCDAPKDWRFGSAAFVPQGGTRA